MKKANWLKIASFIGMGLGFIGTIISDYASAEQNKMDIKEQVDEHIRTYFAEYWDWRMANNSHEEVA